MEFLSPEGLRLDGRRPKELRKLHCEVGTLGEADGSATFDMGNTKVQACQPVCSARQTCQRLHSLACSQLGKKLFQLILHSTCL